MSRRPLVLVILAGCGFRTAAIPNDGSIDDTPDVPLDTPPATACFGHWLDHSVTFARTTALDTLNTPLTFERDPFVTVDLETLYFASDRIKAGDGDIYVATRATPALPFGAPVLVAGASSTGDDSKLSLSDDGTVAALATTRTGADAQGGLDVWLSSPTAGTLGAFSETHTLSVNDNSSQYDPEISANGLHLYLAPSLGGAQRIALATRGDTASDFSQPTALAAINSGDGDADPTVSPDERVIVFSSKRPGGQGNSVDLYYATRASASVDFDSPVKLTALNTSDDENDPMLSHDGCHLIFSRHLNGSNWDLFEAVVAP